MIERTLVHARSSSILMLRPDRVDRSRKFSLTQKSKVLRRKLAQIREDSCQQSRIQSIPLRQRRTVLINRGRRYPAAAIATIVVRAIGDQGRIGSVERAPQHRAAHDKGVTAPRVIGADSGCARAGWLEGAAEIRKREE